MLRKILIGLGVVIIALGAAGLYFQDRIERLVMVSSLFTGAEQYDRFNRVETIFPSSEMPPAPQPVRFAEGQPIALPRSYGYGGAQKDTAQFLEDTDTAALLVLQDGKIIFENYWLTGGPDVTWLSMSVSKSLFRR